MSTIDLNSDLGEGFGRWSLGDDLEMLGIVTSANIACGFHAGDPLVGADQLGGAGRAHEPAPAAGGGAGRRSGHAAV